MSDSPEPGRQPRQRPHKEYEDPHYHDDDEVVPADDSVSGERRTPAAKHPRKIPPPRRPRHYED
jgi:hypothetical protein